MQKRLRTLMLTLLTAASASLSAGPVGYSVNSDSPSDDPAVYDALYRIDLASGEIIERVGKVQKTSFDPIRDVEGLAFAPDGTLWGADDESVRLFPIGISNALVDWNDSFPIQGFPTGGGNDFGMTFACDDKLYMTSVGSEAKPNPETDQSLFEVGYPGAGTKGVTNRKGAAGSLGVDISALAAYGNPVKLYGLDNGTGPDGKRALYQINITTGVATKIGPLGPSVGPYDQAGLAFDEVGQLWAIIDRSIAGPGLPSQVMRVNTTTGAASDVRDVPGIGFESLAITVPRGCTSTSPGETATFVVHKWFPDGNDETPFTLNFHCNGGTFFQQSTTMQPDQGFFGRYQMTFTVENIGDGAVNCAIWETALPGYTPEYDCRSDNPLNCSTDEGTGPCYFPDVKAKQQDLCLITNAPTPVPVTVTKAWEENSVGGDYFSTDVTIDLWCDTEIVDGTHIHPNWRLRTSLSDSNGDYDNKDGDYIGEAEIEAKVIPTWYETVAVEDPPLIQPTSVCWTVESDTDSGVELTSDCGDTEATAGMKVNLGSGDSCTMTNTVFFEGIPTLNQYGLLLISAMMLLTGLIAVRRIG